MTDVTIIVCTYDRPAWCEVAVCSALTTAAASGCDVRVLILDNASPLDYAANLAERYGTAYLRMPENTPAAVPIAFGHVDATYAAVLYDDDVLLPNWLPAHLEVMAQDCDVVGGSFHVTDADLRVTATRTVHPPTLADLREGIVSINDGALIRLSAIEGVSWRPDRGQMLWLSMWLRLVTLGRRFGVVDEPTWLYRRHSANRSDHFDAQDYADRAAVLAEFAA